MGELNLERWYLSNKYNHSIFIASIRHEVSYNSLQYKELEQQTHNGELLNGTTIVAEGTHQERTREIKEMSQKKEISNFS